MPRRVWSYPSHLKEASYIGRVPNLAQMSLDPSRLIDMVKLLPYQSGSTLPSDDDGSTKILNSATTAESKMEKRLYMLWHHHNISLYMLDAPNIQDGEETI